MLFTLSQEQSKDRCEHCLQIEAVFNQTAKSVVPYSNTVFGILRYSSNDQSIMNIFNFHQFTSVPTLAIAKALSKGSQSR